MKSCHLRWHDGPRDYYGKLNKPVRERQIPYDFTHVKVKKQNKQAKGKRGERQTERERERERDQETDS